MRLGWIVIVGFIVGSCGSRSELDDPLAVPIPPLDAGDSAVFDAGKDHQLDQQVDQLADHHQDEGTDVLEECPLGLIRCGDQCVDPLVDPEHCGGCFQPCPACTNGTCSTCECGELTTCSSDAACLCVDTSSDPEHCGGCFNACPAGTICSAGVCACACPAGLVCCGPICTDVATDPANCGGCGVTCPAGSKCDQGQCGAPCCFDSQNTSEPPATNCGQGWQWIAWKYVPTCTIDVKRIELHTNGGTVALLQDAGGQAGAVITEAPLPAVWPPDWTGGDFPAPVQLQAGVTYWIASKVQYCSVAAQGTAYPYFASGSLFGGWVGPLEGPAWTSRVIGTCQQ